MFKTINADQYAIRNELGTVSIPCPNLVTPQFTTISWLPDWCLQGKRTSSGIKVLSKSFFKLNIMKMFTLPMLYSKAQTFYNFDDDPALSF